MARSSPPPRRSASAASSIGPASPTEAIRYCLDEAGVSVHELDHVAVNRDPRANLLKKAVFSVRQPAEPPA